jgi:hypothetical protein
MSKRPLPITVIAWIFVAVGAIGFVYHIRGLNAQRPWEEAILPALVGVVAIVCGIYMLRGSNWARWLALVWLAFHVALSIGAVPKLVIHALFLAVFAYFLLRPQASRYFRPAPTP